jgi:Flagellar biosynthesis protein, FliO
MPQASRSRRALRAALGFAVILTLGFAADALVLMTTRARADGAAAPAAVEKGRRSPSADASEDPALLSARGESEPRNAVPRTSRAAIFRRLTNGAQPGGLDSWSPVMIGITVALAVCGGIIAAGRRLLPQGAGVGMEVVGRMSLSPKHTVYLLRVGRRVLLVGAGPQGSPSLISELDDLAEIEPDRPRGEQP